MMDAITLLERHLNARGGLNAIQKIHTLYVSGTMTDSAGKVASIEAWRKRPNLLRVDMSTANGIHKEGFDGRRAWRSSSGIAAPAGESLRNMHDESPFDGALVRASQQSERIISLGECVVAGLPAYGLRIALPGNTATHYYLHKHTYMVAASEHIDAASVSHMTLYTDYQLVGGAMFSHYVVQVAANGAQNETYAWRIYTANTPIEDAIFAFPAANMPHNN